MAQSGMLTNPDTIVLRSSRRKWGRLAAIAAIFVAIGVWMIVEGNPLAWLATAFFGLGLLLSVWQLLVPGQLVVTPDAMHLRNLWKRSTRELAACSEFEVWRSSVNRQPVELVVFDHPYDDARRLGRSNRKLVGRSGSLPDTFGLSAEELAQLLNDRRNAAIKRTAAKVTPHLPSAARATPES